MPEGHSVHRIARRLTETFGGREVETTSPQGRFAEGASVLNGRTLTSARAVGKQMFAEFDEALWLRVHLGIYGSWDFARVRPNAAGRLGQTHEYATSDPRRVRVSEEERSGGPAPAQWPPAVVGQVRLRVLTAEDCADLRGPSRCQVQSPLEAAQTIAALGPDPLVDDPVVGEQRFVDTVRRKKTTIGLLLMDQKVVSGIGNIYRAEMLFRARLNPHIPGCDLPEATVRALYQDWGALLPIGVEVGRIMTMDGLSPRDYQRALRNRQDRHWVYQRAGLPCRVCGIAIVVEPAAGRKLYWCPSCQAEA